jgi:hypothetical protein
MMFCGTHDPLKIEGIAVRNRFLERCAWMMATDRYQEFIEAL